MRRFFSGGAGGTLDFSGVWGGNTVLYIYGEWTCLANMWLEALSYETLFSTVLLVRDWLFILGNLVLNWSTVVADAVTSFHCMYP